MNIDNAILIVTSLGIGSVILYVVQALLPRRKDKQARTATAIDIAGHLQELYMQMAQRVAALEVERAENTQKISDLTAKLKAIETLMMQQRRDLYTLIGQWDVSCNGDIPIDPDKYLNPDNINC